MSSPSSTQASDGLGPLFNARACQSCHLKDGRGHPPENGADATSMFLRLARQAETVEEKTAVAAKQVLNLPDPTYGSQLQDLAVPGLPGEGKMTVAYEERPVTLGDGSTVSLRAPTYAVVRLASGPMHPDTTLSPRVTPPMIGLGLVEQIHPADILAKADPHDRDGDGISGKASVVRDAATGGLALGRFGWKASTASIRQQTAEAFAGDIGISTPEVPQAWGDCTEAADCLPRLAHRRPAPPWGCRSAAARHGPRHLLCRGTSPSPHAAAPASPKCSAASGSSTASAACPATRRNTSPAAMRPTRRRPSSSSGPIRISCCTTWARAWPTASRWATPTGANGARRRFGASG